MPKKSLAGMHWIGGKSGQSPQGIGRWVASLLPPPSRDQLYAEPFAGMLGVLLQRRPAGVEIANDSNGHVINWWRVVRESGDELAREIALSPHSRQLYKESCERLMRGEGTPFRQAVDFTIAIMQGRTAKVGSGWLAGYTHDGSISWRWSRALLGNLPELANRLSYVTLECGLGERILSTLAQKEHALIYVDPPYYSSKLNGLYDESAVDTDLLTDSMRSAAARIAISGYGDEWDHLGWQRHEYPTYRARVGVAGESRTEVV